ncbi:fibronectin type III-like domain-contianing protein [Natronorubrum sp. DTA7]|uniref:fibronectin type III-like domain-contianing protein n=1 Tax=Natronorubrum sp. DTA7 TaxID=3447016 RepID=UPI003F860BE3
MTREQSTTRYRDETAAVAGRVEDLLERVSLEPGESKRVTFELSATQLAFHDLDMNLTVEEGPYEVRIERSSVDIVASESLDVAATKAVPKTGRTYVTPVTVDSIE